MMKLVFHLSLIILILSSCSDDPCFKGSGDQVTISRELSDNIDSLYIYNNLNVDVHLSNRNYVEIDGGENVVPFVKTTVEGTSLKLENENSCDFLRNFDQDLKIRLYLRSFQLVKFYGSGTINFKDTIKGNIIYVRHEAASGTANMLFDVNVIAVRAESGTFDMNFGGHANDMAIYLTGAGVINAKDLLVDNCGIITESSGDCTVNVKTDLEASIRSIGDVLYLGSPSLELLERTSSGNLIPY